MLQVAMDRLLAWIARWYALETDGMVAASAILLEGRVSLSWAMPDWLSEATGNWYTGVLSWRQKFCMLLAFYGRRRSSDEEGLILLLDVNMWEYQHLRG